MANSFEIIGRLAVGKESEKFKPFETKTSEKGWTTTRLVFNAIAGDNRHMLEVKGLHKADGTGKIYSFTKGSTDEKTNEKIKGEKLEIAWKDRNNKDIIEKVAEFKKFVVDLEVYGRRYKLEKAVEKFKEGKLTDEELIELGVEDPVAALEESKKKRKEFLSEVDFAEYLYKLITSGKINDRLFRISGDIVYSEYEGKFYKKLAPTRIYLAEKEAVPNSTGQIVVFYNKESLDTLSFKDTKKYYVNGYVRNYDNNRKADISCPVQLVIDATNEDEKVQKFANLMVKQFTVKDKAWLEFGVKVKLLDGSQKVEITDDMLTDFQKEMLELGAMDMDDIRRELGGDVYGDKIQEMIIINVAKGYSKGRKETVYTNQDFVNKPAENNKPAPQSNTSATNDDDEFGDLDDII